MSSILTHKNIKKRFLSLVRKPQISDFYYIIQDFETSSEKECATMDTKNLERYNHLLKKATKAQKSIGNTGLSMNLEVPPPPTPNNRDRFNLWKRRNISQKVIPQSDAVYFLTKHGYELNKDYEAYQAIGLADQIMKEKGIKKSNEDISKNFNNIFNENDNNIVRRFSIYGMNEYTKARANIVNRNVEAVRTMNYDEFQAHRTQSLPNIAKQSTEENCPSVIPSALPSAPNAPIQIVSSKEHSKSTQSSLYPRCEV